MLTVDLFPAACDGQTGRARSVLASSSIFPSLSRRLTTVNLVLMCTAAWGSEYSLDSNEARAMDIVSNSFWSVDLSTATAANIVG